MRARVYYLGFVLAYIALFLLAATFDPQFTARYFTPGAGYVWFLAFVPAGILLMYVTTVQIRLNSPKLVSDFLSVSLGPTARYKEVPAIYTKTGQLAWPAVVIYELGGGRYGGVNALGGREYGFAIVRKGLDINVEGQIFVNGYTSEYSPPDRAMWRVIAKLLPYQVDERRRLPIAWLEPILKHPRFSPLKSPIYFMDVPLFPYLSGTEENIIIHIPGYPAVLLRDAMKESGAQVLLDLRKRFTDRLGKEVSAVREWAAESEKQANDAMAAMAKRSATLSDVSDRSAPPSLRDRASEFVMGKEEGSTRRE